MIRRINYDFSSIDDACADIILKQSPSNLNKLKIELNRFFKDSKCLEITCTQNDSLFFGACVSPIVDQEMVIKILQTNDKVRFDKYTIEFDSKLFNPILDITPRELAAVVLHEVGHIVNDPNPVEQVRDAINFSVASKGESIKIPTTIQYSQIIAFGIKNTVRKLNSMFFIYKNGEVLADEFVHMCGYGEELNTVFNKIIKSSSRIHNEVNKLVVLSWTLSLYKDVKTKRIPALRLIQKMKPITGSRTEKRELEILEKSLNTIDDMSLQEACNDLSNFDFYYVTEGSGNTHKITKYAELRKNATRKHIKPFEEDVYEYTMRIRHISTEADALYLMRQINTRISVLEDYLEKERLSEAERNKWWSLLEKYYGLREELSKNVHYRYDYSGSVIQVNYPDIVENRM